jgi:hypothetical protein
MERRPSRTPGRRPRGRDRIRRPRTLSRTLLAFPLLPLLLLPSGCSDSSSSPTAQQIELRFQAWEARGIRNYAFTYQRTCPGCTQEEQEMVRIRVEEGAVAGVSRSASGEELPAAQWPSWPTISQLFQELLDHVRTQVGETSVAFDEEWDIPVFASAIVTGEIGRGFSFVIQDFAVP